MNSRERVLIYAVLTVLVVLNLSFMLGRSGSIALADPLSFMGELGPADSLTLLDAKGEKDLVLRNSDGRLSWGEASHDKAYSVAYVYIGKILNQLMLSEELDEDRQRLIKELQETEAGFRQRLDEVVGRLRLLDPESAEAAQVNQEGEALYEEMVQWQQEAVRKRGKLDAEQMEKAYREMIDAVEVVADRKGIDTVYRFVPTEEPFDTENPEAAIMAIRLRTALRYPEDLDITDDVVEELDLEVE